MDNYVKRYRNKKRLSQEDLAKKVFCSRITISNIERRIYTPSVILSLRIAEVLNADIKDLFILDFEDWIKEEKEL